MNVPKFIGMSALLLVSMKTMGREPVFNVYNHTPYVVHINFKGQKEVDVPGAAVLETTNPDHKLLRPSFSQYGKSPVKILERVDITTDYLNVAKLQHWDSYKHWSDGAHDTTVTIGRNGEIEIKSELVLGRQIKALVEEIQQKPIPTFIRNMRFTR